MRYRPHKLAVSNTSVPSMSINKQQSVALYTAADAIRATTVERVFCRILVEGAIYWFFFDHIVRLGEELNKEDTEDDLVHGVVNTKPGTGDSSVEKPGRVWRPFGRRVL